MAASLDQEPLEASHFNTIPPFEPRTVDPDDLACISAIYIENRMHVSWGVGLLHRHFPQRDGYILLHTTYTKDVDICKTVPRDSLDSAQLYPHSIFLNKKCQFQAFEYDYGGAERTPMNDGFLRQLRDFLCRRDLQGTIAIVPCPESKASGNFVEFLLPESEGMKTVPEFHVEDIDLKDSVVTGWRFYHGHDGAPEFEAFQECMRDATGLHTVKY